MRAPSAPCGPAASTEAGPKPDGSQSITDELHSIRRRLTNPEPGTISALRVRRRIVLHEILGSRRSSEVTQ